MTPRHRRTPKVKEFVHAPFVQCPDCGKEKLGVLMICDRHYVRRCINCWFDQSLPLPPIQKRVVYLDQLVISNMMKELDPASGPAAKGTNNGFFRTLFERLDRLKKLQLIVCPESPVHLEESVVDPRFKNLRRVFRHFSHGLGFKSPDTIFHAHLLAAFRGWLRDVPPEPLSGDFAFTGNRNVWNERFRIDLNFTVSGFATSLKNISDSRTKHLREVCERWQEAPTFSFQAAFENELRTIVQEPRRVYSEYVARLAVEEGGRVPVGLAESFPMSVANLITQMLAEVDEDNAGVRFDKVAQFFDSEAARSISFARITALFWASLARDVRAGRKPENFPTASLYNDVDVAAGYAQFCDAMFVDKQISHLASQAELKSELAGCCRLFSFRKGEADQFLDFLAKIEAEASPAHLQKVAEVYGPDWPTPYVERGSFGERFVIAQSAEMFGRRGELGQVPDCRSTCPLWPWSPPTPQEAG